MKQLFFEIQIGRSNECPFQKSMFYYRNQDIEVDLKH